MVEELRKFTASVYKLSTVYDTNPKTEVLMPAVFVPLTILKSLAKIRHVFKRLKSNQTELFWHFSDRESWINYVLITNLMH